MSQLGGKKIYVSNGSKNITGILQVPKCFRCEMGVKNNQVSNGCKNILGVN